MAWHKNFSLALATAAAVVVLAGCNVGKTDTVATPTPTVVSNTGTYEGGFNSPVKLLCIDPPGLDPSGHGQCGQRYTLEGSVSLIVQGNTVTGGNVSVYGYDSPLTSASAIDAAGNFNFSHGHINGKARVVNGVMTGTVWEGPFEWKYGEFKHTKK